MELVHTIKKLSKTVENCGVWAYPKRKIPTGMFGNSPIVRGVFLHEIPWKLQLIVKESS